MSPSSFIKSRGVRRVTIAINEAAATVVGIDQGTPIAGKAYVEQFGGAVKFSV